MLWKPQREHDKYAVIILERRRCSACCHASVANNLGFSDKWNAWSASLALFHHLFKPICFICEQKASKMCLLSTLSSHSLSLSHSAFQIQFTTFGNTEATVMNELTSKRMCSPASTAKLPALLSWAQQFRNCQHIGRPLLLALPLLLLGSRVRNHWRNVPHLYYTR